MSDNLKILLTTFTDTESAETIVRQLLDEYLIACGTLLPGATSFYPWEGEITKASEVVVLMKTDRERSARCMTRLQGLHPYEVPEIILLEPEAVSGPYAAWVRDALGKPSLSSDDQYAFGALKIHLARSRPLAVFSGLRNEG
jgi:periplasmic divalent cation tolerance protein